MFPTEIEQDGKSYIQIPTGISKEELRTLLLLNPYSVYALVDENIEGELDRPLTSFLVVFAKEFDENIILYDISSQIHSTLMINIDFVLEKKIEVIDIGLVEFYPIQLYQEKNNEII